MVLVLTLAAVLATDIAVAALYLALRPRQGKQRPAVPDAAISREIEEMVLRLRMQTEQATAEIGRQKAQIRRMLAGVDLAPQTAEGAEPPKLPDRQQAQAVALRGGHAVALPATPKSGSRDAPPRERVLQLATQGLPARDIAGRTRVSVEEVRLLIAMEDARATA